ncbi:E3 ubiquitin-protein ligase AMFR isoform X2 [Agrilus planipennis]|uniref:E3 ubiquitin-protein ligase AMFR isoform X2 n=1 Tax=Agrilus planipennis TaxID=224129 RepID=A0A7F5R6U7_AGRPL|nr:E3 ubiquitin-protein ligase AMFR isoform X2 [Agrilus planipennis]
MPVILLNRLPLPNLKTYVCLSVLALSSCVYFATTVIKNPDWNKGKSGISNENETFNETDKFSGDTRPLRQYISEIFLVMVHEAVCVWVMINMACCCLILLGRCIQKLVFDELRISEQQHLEEKFWNFIFYKFIFVFGVINVQYMDEVLLWCSWFSLLGFLHLLSQLSKDRFEYLSFSLTTPVWNHVKLLTLLICIFALSGFMLLISTFVGFFEGLNTFAFMSAEVILLSLRTVHVILRYVMHLYDVFRDGSGSVSNVSSSVWEKRGPVVYYVELVFEMSAYIIDFVHHLHMLVWSNIFLSMASLVICMQLRYLFHELQRRYKKHRNYLWVLKHMEQNYPIASPDELSQNCDNCAICWEKMESARKLPCNHLFHTMCLQSWLEQDKSCPTCRLTLNIETPMGGRVELLPELQNDPPQPTRRHLNHFFHFDGSRYVSWLPSFSVEVSHAQLVRPDQLVATNSQLDAMARQVQQMFPHIPLSTIVDDLRVTRSVELTVENILEGHVVPPPIFRELDVRPTVVPMSTNSRNSPTGDSFNVDEESSENWDELTSDNVDMEEFSGLGSRFSKSSSEREYMLHKRKEQMLRVARKKYMEKQKTKLDSSQR